MPLKKGTYTPRPTVSALLRVTGGDYEQAHAARRLLLATREELLARSSAARALEQQSYHLQPVERLRMEALNEALGLFGVESIQLGDNDYLYFLNVGDAYKETVTLRNGHYRVQSWGDVVEAAERRGQRARLIPSAQLG